MPIEPATNPVWTQTIKTLDEKPEVDRSDFERQFFARLVELNNLIEAGNRSVERYSELLETAKEQTLKACGAYENTADMLAVYYMQKRQEEAQEVLEKVEGVTEHLSRTSQIIKKISEQRTPKIEPIKVKVEVKPEQTS